jgi:hypothetical protein
LQSLANLSYSVAWKSERKIKKIIKKLIEAQLWVEGRYWILQWLSWTEKKIVHPPTTFIRPHENLAPLRGGRDYFVQYQSIRVSQTLFSIFSTKQHYLNIKMGFFGIISCELIHVSLVFHNEPLRCREPVTKPRFGLCDTFFFSSFFSKSRKVQSILRYYFCQSRLLKRHLPGYTSTNQPTRANTPLQDIFNVILSLYDGLRVWRRLSLSLVFDNDATAFFLATVPWHSFDYCLSWRRIPKCQYWP